MDLCLISHQTLIFRRKQDEYVEFIDSESSDSDSDIGPRDPRERRMRSEFETEIATANLETLPNFGAGITLGKEDNGGNEARTGAGGRKRQRLNDELDKSLTVELRRRSTHRQGTLTISSKNSEKTYFWQLGKALGGAFSVNVEVELGQIPERARVAKEEFKIYRGCGPNNVTAMIGCGSFTLTDPLMRQWMWRKPFIGKLTMTLKLKVEHLEDILKVGKTPDPLAINKRLRMDAESADVLIVPGSGEGVKCHKVFLGAHSAAFKAMFESGMKEGVTKTVKMPEMSSAGVHALVDYLYYWDITKASNSSSVAMELLMVADRYSIESLEKSMLELIRTKENNWFSPTVTLQLIHFARNKFENENLIAYRLLECKAVAVLKSKPTTNLEQCQEYQDLFKNPRVGMEFCSYLIRSYQ